MRAAGEASPTVFWITVPLTSVCVGWFPIGSECQSGMIIYTMPQ